MQTVLSILLLSVGTVSLVAGLEGWCLGRANLLERAAFIAVAPLMLYPGAATDAAGFVLLAAVLAAQWFTRRPASPSMGNA